MINRRHLLGAGAAAALYGGMSARAATLPLSTLISASFVEVETAAGKIRGGHSRGAIAFKGIPYAGPVSGANRFKAAPPVIPWSGVFDATRLGPPSLQTPHSTYGENEPAYSEDCLVLNVWTPVGFNAAEARAHKRPVMVYFHGGGYSTGSAGSVTQDGARLAAVYDTIVVAPNHRLGLLGFLYLGDVLGPDYVSSGNQSMTDMIAALHWVQDNIAVFGGDPGNVTIFGESGGGGKVGTLLGMPAARGLFHKACIQSGAQLKHMSKATASETTQRLLKALDISDAAKLLEVPADMLLALQWAGEAGKGPLMTPTDGSVSTPRSTLMDISFSESAIAGHFGPVVDGLYLPADPFDPAAIPLCADVPLMIGFNRTEASFFNLPKPETFDMDEQALVMRLDAEFGEKAPALRAVYRQMHPRMTPSELYLAIATARTMGNETVTLATLKSRQPAPVYLYRWDYDSNFPIPNSRHTLGPGHATDIGPSFYNWDESGLHGNGPGVEAASRHLSALLTRFAATGTPSAKDVPAWPRYDSQTRPTLLVNSDCTLVHDPDGAARAVWGQLSGAPTGKSG